MAHETSLGANMPIEPLPPTAPATSTTYHHSDSDVDYESDESDMDEESVRQRLLEDLDRIQASGSFSFSGELDQPPPCGISVPGIGKIRLPLDEAQAQELIGLARQAPYGKGEETIVDTSVRNTWELDASQFVCENSKWGTWVQFICERVVKPELGITPTRPVRAELYKMLIYEKGAMFKAHTDSEKTPGMFGTLVVALPSDHKGGDVVLKHCGKQKAFKSSKYKQSLACWYSDVTHEVLPVESGRRWVLTFNLVLGPEPQTAPNALPPRAPSATIQFVEKSVLRRTLEKWLSLKLMLSSCHQVCHVLDHTYSEASISFKALKGRDLAQVRALKELSKELPFDIFLASLERETREEDDWDPYYGGSGFAGETLDEDYTIKVLSDLNNNVAMRDVAMEKEDLLIGEYFDDLEPDRSEQGYTGNEGGGSQNWYRVTAVVLVPHEHLSPFLCPPPESTTWRTDYSVKNNIATVLPYLVRSVVNAQHLGKALERLFLVCLRAGARKIPIGGANMAEALKVMVRYGQFPMFEQTAAKHKGTVSMDFFGWIAGWLDYTREGQGEKKWTDIEKSLSVAVSGFATLHQQFEAVSQVYPAEDNNKPESLPPVCARILTWARDMLTKCIDAKVVNRSQVHDESSVLTRDDGIALVNLTRYFPEPEKMLADVVEKVKDRTDSPAFSLSFMARVLERTSQDHCSKQHGESLHETLARSFVSHIDFASLSRTPDVSAAPAAKIPRYGVPPPTIDRRVLVTPSELVTFVSDLIASQPEGEDGKLLPLFVERLTSQVDTLPVEALNTLWVPFLYTLLPKLAERGIPDHDPRYQALFSTLLTAYATKYVRREPAKGQDLIRRQVACSCRDCTWLNTFLADSRAKVQSFTIGKDRRRHLHQQLEAARIDCSHVTDHTGRTHTMVVTKTFRANDAARRQWKERRTAAWQHMKEFQRTELVALLGEGQYDKLVLMKDLSAAGTAALGELSANQQPRLAPTVRPRQVSGVKRSRADAEQVVIDLTSD